jgi:hypothetical protein
MPTTPTILIPVAPMFEPRNDRRMRPDLTLKAGAGQLAKESLMEPRLPRAH